MIEVVEAGDAKNTMRQLMPPHEFEKFLEASDVEDELARFGEKKPPRLLEMLKTLDVSKAEFSGGKAVFSIEPRSVTFNKVDGEWHLSN